MIGLFDDALFGLGRHIFVPPKKLVKCLLQVVSVNEGMESWKNPFVNKNLGGGFKYFIFSPLLGEDSQFDQYFSEGLKPPTRQSANFKDFSLVK